MKPTAEKQGHAPSLLTAAKEAHAIINEAASRILSPRDNTMRRAADQLGAAIVEHETSLAELMGAADTLLEKISHVCGVEAERRALIEALQKAETR